MKNIKKKVLILLLVLIFAVIGVGIGLYLSSRKSSNFLTLEETQWIDTNKHNVIDVAVINDAPLISYEGEGLLYDYLNYVTEKTKLEFNIIPYKTGGTVDSKYKLNIVSSPSKDDVVIYKDNIIYISADGKEYTQEDEINNLKIGVLKSEKEELAKYFDGKKIELVEYEDYTKLKAAIKEAKTNVEAGTQPSINGILILKTLFAKEIIENNYTISYIFNDMDRYYALNILESPELKGIMTKQYNNWNNTLYKQSYNSSLSNIYYKFKNLSDVDEKKLKSEKYTYGFISQGIINHIEKRELKGFNAVLLKDFKEFSGLTIDYKNYNSIINLIENFNNGKVDFILNLVDKTKLKKESYETYDLYEKKLVIVSGINNRDFINNPSLLKDKEVLTIKDTNLEDYLNEVGAKVKSYNDLDGLVKDFSSKSLAIIDFENYNYYKTSYLKDSKINYIFNDNLKYKFIVNNDDKNKVFGNMLNFYISYNNLDELITNNYNEVAYRNSNITFVLMIIILALLVYIVIDFMGHMKKLFAAIKIRRKVKMSKEDKMKYIDQLTSLKNRNYLNSKIEEWDESEVYPQSVIIVDLNNVSYINDNYGREEGDKVIKEAANILMQCQLENSEIIRTDGNEFLIFLVGYTEKQVVSYLRKLTKEFKNLSHGFGAASGYSIITDAIKTFDDAVNEAVLDMKNNKEDIDY